VGGRIWTVHDPLSPLPVELGAEFVHGRPEEIWSLIDAGNLTAIEHTSRAIHLRNGRTADESETRYAERLIEEIDKPGRPPDQSFEDYLQHTPASPDAKSWARVHVEGFEAARSEEISVESLIQETTAAGKIDGERAFRIAQGYDSIPLAILREIPDYPSVVVLNSAVQSVRWRPGRVEAGFQSTLDGDAGSLVCRQLVVTVPLGLLQSETIAFDPKPHSALRAARSLRFGQVYRVTLRFREAFWQEDERYRSAGFLISQDPRFFTWWTTHPMVSPLLTGWMAGSAAERFRPDDPQKVMEEAVESLGRILNRKVPRPEAFYFHDWQKDPYSLGAYSYQPKGARGAREALAEPESDTLFFAGEAAELDGHNGTVHGAIASGQRAAALVVSASRTREMTSGQPDSF
jgi:monoamine oxidase